MAYHDHLAEIKGYYIFEHRTISADPHFHSAPEFAFIEEGEILVTINGETRILKAGDACFSSTFLVHSYKKESEHNKAYILLVPKEYANNLFNGFHQTEPPAFFHFDNFKLLNFLFSLCNQNDIEQKYKYGIFESSIQMLYNLIASKNSFVSRQQDNQAALIVNILNYAEKNFKNALTLDVLSKQFGYARETISRILHQYLQESWNSYVNRLRVYHVQQILAKSPSSSIIDIAFNCGFNSSNTFYRAYLREFGIPPKRT